MLSRLTTEISPRPVGLTRIVVGIAATLKALIVVPVLVDLTHAQTLRAPYAEWLPDPSIGIVVVLEIVWVFSAILFTVGWKVRFTGPTLLVAIAATITIDQQLYANHVYLMAWLVLLLTIADSGSGLAIGGMERRVVRWPVLLLMAQVSIVYGFSALTKMNADFLSGRILGGLVGQGVVPFPQALHIQGLFSSLAVLVVFVELFVAIFLWRSSWRPVAFGLGLGLHVSIVLFMSPVSDLVVFSLETLAVYPLFLGGERLELAWQTGCARCADTVRRVRRFDVLDVIDDRHHGPGESSHLVLSHRGVRSYGSVAVTRCMEHLVPHLWIAPMLRLPGIRHVRGRRERRAHLVTGRSVSRARP